MWEETGAPGGKLTQSQGERANSTIRIKPRSLALQGSNSIAAPPCHPVLCHSYRCMVGSILTVCITIWFANSHVQEQRRLQRVVDLPGPSQVLNSPLSKGSTGGDASKRQPASSKTHTTLATLIPLYHRDDVQVQEQLLLSNHQALEPHCDLDLLWTVSLVTLLTLLLYYYDYRVIRLYRMETGPTAQLVYLS